MPDIQLPELGAEEPEFREEIQPVAPEAIPLRIDSNLLCLFRDNHAVVIYRRPWIIALTLLGLIAFGSVAFLGYPSDGQRLYPLDHPVWILFVWFSLVIILIQWMIFRDSNVTIRNWRFQTIAATLFFVACGIVVYAKPSIVNDLIDKLDHTPGAQRTSEIALWHIVNFGLLLIYLSDRVRLWLTGERMRMADELAGSRAAAAQARHSLIPDTFWRLDRWELLSQDFFGGAVLAFALSLLLRNDILNGLLGILPLHHVDIHIDQCAVTLAIGTCQNGAAHNPQTLAGLDLSLGLTALVISLVILVLNVIPRTLELVAEDAAPNIAAAVGKTLLAIFNPLDVFLRTLRVIIWPALIGLGVLLAAVSARFIRQYLHLLSDKQTCAGTRSCDDLHELGLYLSNSIDPRYFQGHAFSIEVILLALALASAVGALLMILASAQALVFGRTDRLWLIPNWLQFAGVLGMIIACFFWILSIILSLSMYAIQSFALTQRTPFPQPGISTMLSLLVFLILLVIALPPFRTHWARNLLDAMASFWGVFLADHTPRRRVE